MDDSDTVRFTVRAELGAALAVSVKEAEVPSVTGEVPAAMVMEGSVVELDSVPLIAILTVVDERELQALESLNFHSLPLPMLQPVSPV